MPEGHTIHRAARDQRPMFAGQVLSVSSPQGRFSDGAACIDGQRCNSIEAFGKHLIYRFDSGDSLHIHLGLFGRIREHRTPAREPQGAVRVRLASVTHVVDINGPTICEVLNEPGLLRLIDRIGPDVLRPDADPQRAFKRITKSRASIGRLIMDQSVMAGIGNIYRSEILWRQRVHPETPGRDIDHQTFERLWTDAVALLAIGVKRNAIITVDGAAPSRKRYRERVNIFGKQTCPACQGPVRRLEFDNRRVFMCDQCQPAG